MMFGLAFPAILMGPQSTTLGQLSSYYLGRLAVYSPVLAGMIVTRIHQPAALLATSARKPGIFLPVWLVSVVLQTASIAQGAPPGTNLTQLVLVSLPVALLPAVVITMAFAGGPGMRRMLETLVRPRGNFRYYLIALLTFPFVHIVGTGITNLRNGNPWFPQTGLPPGLASTLMIMFASTLFYSGGFNEEAGWRGFVQKRLQARYSPLVAGLILWVMMLIWHIPNDILQYRDGGYLMVRIALFPFIIILFNWTYNRTRGSILAPALFHASMNSMNPLMGVFPITTAGNILLVVLALLALVSDRMWRRLPADHPAVFQEIVPTAAPG